MVVVAVGCVVVVAVGGVVVVAAVPALLAAFLAGCDCHTAWAAVARASRARRPAVVLLSWPDVFSVCTSETNSPKTVW
ncbi:MAG: hypothetical protein ACRDLT_17525, partial [Solirubrobacteraceae bacterium]